MNSSTARQWIKFYYMAGPLKQPCEYWQAMDVLYSTPEDSPLHHNARHKYLECNPSDYGRVEQWEIREIRDNEPAHTVVNFVNGSFVCSCKRQAWIV